MVFQPTTRLRLAIGWVVLVGGALCSLVLIGPAGAHADLLQASPGPTQRVGGEVDFIDLVFVEEVTGAQITVEFEGDPVAGEMVEPNGRFIRYSFAEPLSSEGRYDVRYRIVSADLDETTESYFFSFTPGAPQPVRLGTVDSDGPNWVLLVVSGVLIASLLGLAFLLLSRVEASRARSEVGDDGASLD